MGEVFGNKEKAVRNPLGKKEIRRGCIIRKRDRS
jgi:hypothetical protein